MKKLALLLADLFVLYGALALTLGIRYSGEFWHQAQLHFPPFSLLFLVWLLVFYINNLYDTQNLRNTTLFYSTLLRSILIAGAASAAFFYITPIFGITPRANLFLFMFLFALLEIANRAFFNEIIEKRFHRRTMIVGINPISQELAQFFKQNPQLGYDLRSIVDINPDSLKKSENELAEYGIIQGLSNIDETIRKEKISVVILSPEAYQIKEIIEIFYKSLEYQVNFYNLATIY
jgi:FlaA1/EpsC-like NDP-sugar epimerase